MRSGRDQITKMFGMFLPSQPKLTLAAGISRLVVKIARFFSGGSFLRTPGGVAGRQGWGPRRSGDRACHGPAESFESGQGEVTPPTGLDKEPSRRGAAPGWRKSPRNGPRSEEARDPDELENANAGEPVRMAGATTFLFSAHEGRGSMWVHRAQQAPVSGHLVCLA